MLPWIAGGLLEETKAAILACQKYLQLVPNGDLADAVREQVEALSNEGTAITG